MCIRDSKNSIDEEGYAMISSIARQLVEAKSTNILVTGYADHIGSDSYNKTLSLQRADTIKQLLVERGVNPSSIEIYGASSSNPVKSCSTNMSRANYIECLKPNRRITITTK